MTPLQFNKQLEKLLGKDYTWSCSYMCNEYRVIVHKMINIMRTVIKSDISICSGSGDTQERAFKDCVGHVKH